MLLPKVPQLNGSERVYSLELPLTERVNKRGDKESVNLNIYRNQHHYKRNTQKKSFHKRMEKPLKKLPKLGKVWLHYEVCPKTRRRMDTMNFGSVIDKFFSDALVEHGVLTDDNYEFVVFNSFCFGSIEKENPHCLVTIIEIQDQKDQDMQLSMTANLSTDDILQAIATWVSIETGQECGPDDISLSTEDVSATATLGDESPATKPVETSTPKRKRRTKAEIEADNKAAEEKANGADDTNVSDSSDSDGGGSDQDSETQAEDSSETTTSETSKRFAKECTDEDKKRKNDSTESQDESSPTDSAESETPKEPVTPKKKKSSIFAQ